MLERGKHHGTESMETIAGGAFEENSGKSNTSTVRGESSALFVVQRPDAAAYIAVAS